MWNNEINYRVRFKEDTRDVCIIEADAPIDVEKMRNFIRKTRRVFHLTDDVEILVIEERHVIKRRNVTSEIIGVDANTNHFHLYDTALGIRDAHENGEIAPLESYRQMREAFGWDDDKDRPA